MSTVTAPQRSPDTMVTAAALRTPRAAGFAGVAFAVLLITALVLVRLAIPGRASEAGSWLSDSGRRNSVIFALYLIPFAGITFLWFIGVVRDRIGAAEDRLFATVFLGSGLLFVAMLFVASASTEGIIAIAAHSRSHSIPADLWWFGHQLTNTVLNVYAMRMAAVFMISTSTILLRGGIMPRWLAISGYLIAAVLLVSVGFFQWIELLFPVWVLILSSSILIESYRDDRIEAGSVGSPT